MKINLYSIIPAHVRYDRTLTDKSILLFGEISAAANAYGICEEDNSYFSVALNCDARTITRCVTQLCEAGHLERIKEGGKRKLKIIQRGLEIPLGVEIESDQIVPKEDITSFANQLIETWERALNTKIDKKEMYTELIASRLMNFTKDELMEALRNRASYVNQAPWFKEPENRQMATSLEILLKSNESTLKWLNAKIKDEKQSVQSFKKNL